jgi:hemolysin activation/secretion protein
MTGKKLISRAVSLAFGPAVLALSASCGPAMAQSPAPTAATAAVPEAEPKVEVRGFTITGGTLLDSTAMAAVLGRYKGQRTFAELREAAQTVQAMYVDAGYGAVVAYIPPQGVSDGNVTINIVEGKVAKVNVKGNQRLSEARVRAALPTLLEGVTPRVRRIDAELQIANENPARQMGVLLGPGAKAGEVEATVNIAEDPVLRFNIGADDTGNDRTGKYRLSAGLQHADITGHDDVFNLQLQTSPTESSAVKVVSSSYRLPLPSLLSAIELFAAYSDVDGGTTPTGAGDLSFNGRGRVAGARSLWYLPRLGEFDQRFSFGLDHRAYLNDCQISGLPAGACGPAGESVTVNPLTLEYSAQSGSRVSAGFNVSVSHNLGIGGSNTDAASFEAVRTGAKSGYTVMRAGGSVSVPVLEEWSLGGRVALQYSGDSLVPGEQFGIGGANSVRGYEEREVSGDRGAFASVEFSTPRLGAAAAPKVDLRLLAFADAGQVSQRGGATCAGTKTSCALSSVGIGARLSYGSNLQARLYVANALKDGVTTQRNDWRSHFAINASF